MKQFFSFLIVAAYLAFPSKYCDLPCSRSSSLSLVLWYLRLGTFNLFRIIVSSTVHQGTALIDTAYDEVRCVSNDLLHANSTTREIPRLTFQCPFRSSLDSLENANYHGYLIEEIRKGVSILERVNWTIEFAWVKAHISIYGNEPADRLAKDAARNRDTTIVFNRIQNSTLYSEIEGAKQRRQKEWENCKKAVITKQFFPNITTGLN